MTPVVFGLEVLCSSPETYSVTGRIGLLSNFASQTRSGLTILSALRNANVQLAALFAPEHGYLGLGAAGESIADDMLGNLPVYSLYGTGAQHYPPPESLGGLQAMLIDLQDIGTRWYTFLAIARDMLHACAAAGVPVLVLDRPNPQGGLIVEGPLAEPAYFSIIGPGALPIRYGLTFGEAVQWLNNQATPPDRAQLTVVPMRGWSRAMLYPDTGHLWVAPSPNMPSPTTVLVYTGTCLIEGTNLSEGRGTALPFEQIGAPYITQPEALSDELNQLGLPGIAWRPAWFRPGLSKHAGQPCGGVRVFVTDPSEVRGFTLGVHLISTLRRLYPAGFAWAIWNEQNAFDKLAGGLRLRVDLERQRPAAEIIDQAASEARSFQLQSVSAQLYT